MHVSLLIAFAAVAAIAIATPGPTVLLAFSNGSRFGIRPALAGMAGAVLSDFVLVGAVGLGLGALLAASEFWFTVLKWLGVAYLMFLGVMMLRSTGSLGDAAKQFETRQGSAKSLFLKSFLVAVTNPKGYLFCSAFLPQFIDPAMPQASQYLALAIVFASLDFIIMLGYAILGSQAARALTGATARWLDRVCGGVLLALAGSLAFYRRTA
jgi:threonine/homoserine/homoserine lactone efflux protein